MKLQVMCSKSHVPYTPFIILTGKVTEALVLYPHMSSNALADRLKELGDPSGRQDPDYWDDWFEIVCRQNDKHQPFEWYCGVEEVVRVLSFHLLENHVSSDETIEVHHDSPRKMIHPGSGTSLVPLELQQSFPGHSHVLVDISQVAIDEIKHLHKQHTTDDRRVVLEYYVSNVLNPPLVMFADETFDCWIDKGFIDAVFKENKNENKDQASRLFSEVSRLLYADEQEAGIAVIISLAEDHSLELILENWLCGSLPWSDCLHVWELQPISGRRQPFGFVLTKSITSGKERQANKSILWHATDGDSMEYHFNDDEVVPSLKRLVQTSHDSFNKAECEKETVQRVLATLEVKPRNASTDLVGLSERLLQQEWQVFDEARGESVVIRPDWQVFKTDDGEERATHALIPIGFGIFKLQLKCIVNSDHLEGLVSEIEEWEVDSGDEGIQSVDVDWDNTVPIVEAYNMLLPQGSLHIENKL